MDVAFVEIAAYLPTQEALVLVGLLQADGIDARALPQGDALSPYRGPAGHSFSRVVVPERLAARAKWVMEHSTPDSAPTSDYDPEAKD